MVCVVRGRGGSWLWVSLVGWFVMGGVGVNVRSEGVGSGRGCVHRCDQ